MYLLLVRCLDTELLDKISKLKTPPVASVLHCYSKLNKCVLELSFNIHNWFELVLALLTAC